MYQIQIDKTNAIVDFILDGYIRVDEMQKFVAELKNATMSLTGRDIKIKADVRTFKPASPEAAEMIRQVQEFGLRSGVKRVAELVESQIVALQLNRVARESGTDKVLRRFWEDSAARHWLIHGDTAEEGSTP
ncbi:STAS/SEC14 domain-containing protein [Hyalangium gracile]|uniref:STAS/SEC14 domain-containing protein n=1 Tax=Hyalangium gracile TaxID=394092 RepID=UPI001CCA0F20|nr:STAS/SEC14 domain-containing protein [Hyalangium gracile]